MDISPFQKEPPPETYGDNGAPPFYKKLFSSKRGFVVTALSVAVALMLLMGIWFWIEWLNLPSLTCIQEEGIHLNKWTQIFARDNTAILTNGKFLQKRISLDKVSPHITKALISTEDRRFFDHKGVDPVSIARAVVANLRAGGVREGGSTLSQQLARNIFLSNQRTLRRKVREALLAIKMEQQLSKEQILTLYFNHVYFGEGAYGVQAASETYFGKNPAQLTLPQAALLAGMPQAPTDYNPFHHPEAAKKRRNEVIDNLAETGEITPREAENYKSTPLGLTSLKPGLGEGNRAPYFNQYIMRQVMEQMDLDEQGFWQSGLRIYTTLDLKAQRLAESALKKQMAAFGRTGTGQQGAVVSVDPKTGAILAYVGGKDFTESQFDRANLAKRSPGSTFKVFTYTTALEQGYEPDRVYYDGPVSYNGWTPRNYDHTHHGYMTMARALARSNNIVAVKVAHDVTPGAIIETATRMGIDSPLNNNLAITLGASSASPLEMTGAVATLANNGNFNRPWGIERITDSDGRVLDEHRERPEQAVDPAVAQTMVGMLRGVVDVGTGYWAKVPGYDVAGKTGTSDDNRDAWFIGFTPNVLTAVWVGNDNNSPMPSSISGGSLPALIWKTMMRPYLATQPRDRFELPLAKPLPASIFNDYDIDKLAESEKGNTPEPTEDEELDEEAMMDGEMNPDGVPLPDGSLPPGATLNPDGSPRLRTGQQPENGQEDPSKLKQWWNRMRDTLEDEPAPQQPPAGTTYRAPAGPPPPPVAPAAPQPPAPQRTAPQTEPTGSNPPVPR